MEAWSALWGETERRSGGKDTALAVLVLKSGVLPGEHEVALSEVRRAMKGMVGRWKSPDMLWERNDIEQELNMALIKELRKPPEETLPALLGRLLGADPTLMYLPFAACRDYRDRHRHLQRRKKTAEFIHLPGTAENSGSNVEAIGAALSASLQGWDPGVWRPEGTRDAGRRPQEEIASFLWFMNPPASFLDQLTPAERDCFDHWRRALARATEDPTFPPWSQIAAEAGRSPATMTRVLEKIREVFPV